MINGNSKQRFVAWPTYHEAGHVIDDIVNAMKGAWDHLAPEMRYVYNDIQNPHLNAARLQGHKVGPGSSPRYRDFGPKDRGYSPSQEMEELIAESLRAYAMNPNYFKTVAPEAAKFIRQAVNRHPQLSRTIQFNELAVGLPAAGLAFGAARDGEHPPSDQNGSDF